MSAKRNPKLKIPQTPREPAREHPATRAAREILGPVDFPELNNNGCDGKVCLHYMSGHDLASIIRRAYAERDGRVLKALEAIEHMAREYCVTSAMVHHTCNCGCTSIRKAARAAIAELKGEGK